MRDKTVRYRHSWNWNCSDKWLQLHSHHHARWKWNSKCFECSADEHKWACVECVLSIRSRRFRIRIRIFKSVSIVFGGFMSKVLCRLTIRFSGNSGGLGGVIHADGGTFRLAIQPFLPTCLNGGVVYARDGSTISSTNNTFQNNLASGFGGVYYLCMEWIFRVGSTYDSNAQTRMVV